MAIQSHSISAEEKHLVHHTGGFLPDSGTIQYIPILPAPRVYSVRPHPETGKPSLYINAELIPEARVDGFSTGDEGQFVHITLPALFVAEEAIEEIKNWLPSQEQADELFKDDVKVEGGDAT